VKLGTLKLIFPCYVSYNIAIHEVIVILVYNNPGGNHMKKLGKVILLFSAFSVLFAFMGCFMDNHVVHAAGDVKKVKKDFSNYSAISVGSGFELIIKQDGSESVEIEAAENILSHIVAEQKGESISFYMERNLSFDRSSPVKIYVSAKNLNALSGSGGSEIKTEGGLKADNLAIELSGGSEFKSKLDCNKTAVELSGGSEMTLSGKSSEFTVSCSGGSEIKASELTTENFTAELSGGSQVHIIITGQLTVEASGGSSVNYTGGGVIKGSDLSGGSEINKK
jgi:hypothetical protein